MLPNTGNSATGPLRLRSTCDRCAALKVRCDKGKPRCERCHASGSQCTYRPYRWKTRASSQSNSTKAGHLPGIPYPERSAPGASEVNITAEDSAAAFPPFSGASGCALAAPPISTDSGFADFDFSSAIPDDIPNELSEPSSMIPPLFARSNQGIFDMSTPETEQDSFTPGTAANLISCSCADTALSIVSELYRGALYETPGPPTNQILNVNRGVIRKLEQLLVGCQGQCACPNDPGLLCILASIISKSLDWYTVVFNGISQSRNADSRPESLQSVPIRFGTFELSTEEARRMEAQFLLCELQSIRRVLSLLAKHAASRCHGGSGRGIGPLVDPVHGFLSSALDKLMASVNSFCVFRLSSRDPGWSTLDS
ncbi:uncharacterized protein BJX67DRAFT_385549 [Aspergillus lucknowensis]|uniref:Zn(2)-C6 fungal-type domain-containing protein n=1 Tax=Aspergillus lucknowensis TaxID=176173 RepID=A0ABR4LGN8_9EURO